MGFAINNGYNGKNQEKSDMIKTILKIVVLVVLAVLVSSCSAFFQNTRCARITVWGISVNEPLLGLFANLGYARYERVAAPSDDKNKYDCPGDTTQQMPATSAISKP